MSTILGNILGNEELGASGRTKPHSARKVGVNYYHSASCTSQTPSYLSALVRPHRLIELMLLGAALTAVVTGCGSAGSQPRSAGRLLEQSLSSRNFARSGVLVAKLTTVPSGSSIISGPLHLTLTGPFVRDARGGLERAEFAVSYHGLSMRADFGLTKIESETYFTLAGRSYRLPSGTTTVDATEQSSATNTTLPGSELPVLMNVDWNAWLKDPMIVGRATVAGVETERVVGTIDPTALLKSVRQLQLAAAKATVASGDAATRSVASEAQIERTGRAFGTPRCELWISTADHQIQQVQVTFTAKLDGSLASVKSAKTTIFVQFQDLNKSQTITAPRTVYPYAQLERKLSPLLDDLSGAKSF